MGDTVGSRGVLSGRQREILVGTLLGDAHLERNGCNFRVRIEHNEKYKDYVFWLAKKLEPFSLAPRYVRDFDKRNGKTYLRWHLSTGSLSLFNEFADFFYKNGRKIVPLKLAKLLTP